MLISMSLLTHLSVHYENSSQCFFNKILWKGLHYHDFTQAKNIEPDSLLPYDRFGFFLKEEKTKASSGMGYPTEALKRLFLYPPSHGETPKRGYV